MTGITFRSASGFAPWRLGGWCAPLLVLALVCLPAPTLDAQVETVEGPRSVPQWTSHGRIEGHLVIKYSSDGAFSPDGSLLAVVNDEKIMLMNLAAGDVHKVLKPHVPDVQDLDIHSANFLSPDQLLVLANGVAHVKGKAPFNTPLLAFEWNVKDDRMEGKLQAVGAKGGFSPARYYPQIGYMVLYKDSNFDLWNPRTAQGGRLTIPDLTQIPNVYDFSPDGHWLLLAQIQTSSNPDPSVVQLKDHKFVDSLRGHQGTVLSMAFSRDAKKIVTACEDGKVRVFSTGDWKLLQTLSGHVGPVHWAEFSPTGDWVVSAGEDQTVRVWSAEDGKQIQSLQESQEPLLNVAFSPDGKFIVASSEDLVLTWVRQGQN
jgi:WD40 repeat protein